MKEENNKRKFLVKWLNHSNKENSWLEEEKFTNLELVENFLRELLKKQSEELDQIDLEKNLDNEYTNNSDTNNLEENNENNLKNDEYNLDNELNIERKRKKLCFKIENSNIFTNKNTVSLALLTNIDLELTNLVI